MNLAPLEAWLRTFSPESRPSERKVRRWVKTGKVAGRIEPDGALLVDLDHFGPAEKSGPSAKSVLLKLYQHTRKNARIRGLEWAIDQQTVISLYVAQDGKCAVTGIEFKTTKLEGARRRPWYPSIDRIRASIGYTPDNVRLVCCSVNIAMNEWGEDVLRTIAVALVAKPKLAHAKDGGSA